MTAGFHESYIGGSGPQIEAYYADVVRRKAREFYEEARHESLAVKAKQSWRHIDASEPTHSPIFLLYATGVRQARPTERFRRRFAVHGDLAAEQCVRSLGDHAGRMHNQWELAQWKYPQQDSVTRNERLRSLTDLGQNWDGYNSRPITQRAIRMADSILQQSSHYAIGTPRIAPVTGGGIELEWTTGRRDLEMEILPDGRWEFVRTHEDGHMEDQQDLPSADTQSLFLWLSE